MRTTTRGWWRSPSSRGAIWREWEERFGVELVSGDGSVLLGPAVARRMPLLREAGVRVREIAERPAARALRRPAMLDDDGGVIRTRAAIAALVAASATDRGRRGVSRSSTDGTVRAGGGVARHDRVVVCAGRGHRGARARRGLDLPVREASHVRLTFPVRGAAPERLPCLQDTRTAPTAIRYPGNDRYASGSATSPTRRSSPVGRAHAPWVAATLPGLVPEPVEVRHCWVTELPWGPTAWRSGTPAARASSPAATCSSTRRGSGGRSRPTIAELRRGAARANVNSGW